MDINVIFVNAIGFVATLFSIFMWVPQARITWQNRNDPIRLAGVSETTQWFSTVGYLLWGIFGLLIGSLWVAAPSLVSFPLSIATIIVVRRGRRLAPMTRTIPIISTTDPMSTVDSMGITPILSTSTGSISVVAAAAVPILSAAALEAPTAPIPVLA